jgi:hypothetical protein
MGSARHRETVVEQFTAQAAGYAQAEPIRNEQALGLRFPIAIVVGERETVH